MYAHQVIEDLKTLAYVPNDKKTAITTAIGNAQKFHFGDSGEIIKPFAKWIGKRRLFIDEIESIAFPYDLLWFDYFLPKEGNATNTRRGLLLEKINKQEFIIVSFGCDDRWNLFDKVYQVTMGTGKLSIGQIYDPSFLPRDEAWETKYLSSTLSVIQCSLLLLNCKNITTETIKAPEALNKKRRKNGKQEIFDYHVLNVTVPSRKGEYREKTEPLSHVRVHLCRGHFKEYTEEHPLFGRLTGLYWWQPHVRGQNKDGIVIKDYKIKTQEAEYGQIGRP
jgi:hypothetical protein